MLELNAKIYGRVHGIGFRATTIVYASELGLTGRVCNCSDGTVEIIAQGQREKLDALIAKLRNHFPSIDSIELQIGKAQKTYSEFTIA